MNKKTNTNTDRRGLGDHPAIVILATIGAVTAIITFTLNVMGIWG